MTGSERNKDDEKHLRRSFLNGVRDLRSCAHPRRVGSHPYVITGRPGPNTSVPRQRDESAPYPTSPPTRTSGRCRGIPDSGSHGRIRFGPRSSQSGRIHPHLPLRFLRDPRDSDGSSPTGPSLIVHQDSGGRWDDSSGLRRTNFYPRPNHSPRHPPVSPRPVPPTVQVSERLGSSTTGWVPSGNPTPEGESRVQEWRGVGSRKHTSLLCLSSNKTQGPRVGGGRDPTGRNHQEGVNDPLGGRLRGWEVEGVFGLGFGHKRKCVSSSSSLRPVTLLQSSATRGRGSER